MLLCSQKYDPGCFSRIRIFFHPGTRGQKHWILDPDPQNCLLFSLALAQPKKMCTEEKRLKITGQYGMFLWSLHPTEVQMLLVDCVLDPDATVTFMFLIRDMLVRMLLSFYAYSFPKVHLHYTFKIKKS
jgi:hypothetical protein